MFNRYFITLNESHQQSDSKSIEKLGKKIEQIAKDEIKSKDRVNISLEEYERMRKQIETLERKNSQRDKLIIQLGIPAEMIDCIDPMSVNVRHCDDHCDFKRDYYIRFTVDMSPDMWKGPCSWL